MKKAQGLSMNVIIIAAIALLVLVIISVLVLRAGGNVNRGTGCTGVGGTCIENPGFTIDNPCSDLGEGYKPDPTHGCGTEDQICCLKF